MPAVVDMGLALSPVEFLRSVSASRETMGKPSVKLIELVSRVSELTDGAPYAVIGGLAQILWARKSHTDDVDIALAASDLANARQRLASGTVDSRWRLPTGSHEENAVFEVDHISFDGSVVDLIAFRFDDFNSEIIASAKSVHELGGVRFIRPELLLVTHLLRPGPSAAIAAVELVIARKALASFDVADARQWAQRVEKGERLERVLAQAEAMKSV